MGWFRHHQNPGPILFALALITWTAMFRKLPGQRANLALLAAVAAATVLPFALIHLEARFILATSFVYMVLAAYGLTEAASWLRGRRTSEVWGAEGLA